VIDEGAPPQLLTRPGCGLCDEFEAAYETLARTLALPPLQRIDVDSDPALARRHGLEIPVLLWRGAIVCKHRFEPAELIRLLRPR
jgi:hypothetical protein